MERFKIGLIKQRARNSFDPHPRPSECVPTRCLGRAMQMK
jgi:hypothetical protein